MVTCMQSLCHLVPESSSNMALAFVVLWFREPIMRNLCGSFLPSGNRFLICRAYILESALCAQTAHSLSEGA